MLGVGGIRHNTALQGELIRLGARFVIAGTDTNYVLAGARQDTEALRAIERIIAREPALPLRPYPAYPAAALMIGAAYAVRVALGPMLVGVPFITFFPAVFGAAVSGRACPRHSCDGARRCSWSGMVGSLGFRSCFRRGSIWERAPSGLRARPVRGGVDPCLFSA